jgi:NTE family protein
MSTRSVAGTPTATASPSLRSVRPETVLLVASVGVFMAYVDATIANIAIPNIGHSFPGTRITGLSWVLNAYNIVLAAFLVPAGRLADALGRKRFFAGALIVFTISSGACAAAPSIGLLIAARAVQALGAAALIPTSIAIIMHAFPPERRTHAVAMSVAVAALGAGIGPALGGALISAQDWRLAFLVNVPIGVAGLLLSFRYLTESRTAGDVRLPDTEGGVLFGAAAALLALAIVEGQQWGWGSARIVGSCAGAVALGALFVWRSRSAREPLFDRGLLRIRQFDVAAAVFTLAMAGFFGYTLINALFLTGVWHYSLLETGAAMTPGPLVAFALARPTSALVERRGFRPVLVAGAALWGFGVLLLAVFSGSHPNFLGFWLPVNCLMGVGAGFVVSNGGSAVVSAAPGDRFATANALLTVLRALGGVVGVAIVVAILGARQLQLVAYQDAWLFGACCLLASAVGYLSLGRRSGQATSPIAPRAIEPVEPVGHS